jgi:hypothetical protein
MCVEHKSKCMPTFIAYSIILKKNFHPNSKPNVCDIIEFYAWDINRMDMCFVVY